MFCVSASCFSCVSSSVLAEKEKEEREKKKGILGGKREPCEECAPGDEITGRRTDLYVHERSRLPSSLKPTVVFVVAGVPPSRPERRLASLLRKLTNDSERAQHKCLFVPLSPNGDGWLRVGRKVRGGRRG